MDKTFTIYTDPFLGNEIIVIRVRDFIFGAIYHPQKTEPLLPWHQTCPHCVRGKQEGLSIQLKRMIQLFCTTTLSEKTTSFRVPSNSEPYLIDLQTKDDGSIDIKARKTNMWSEPYTFTVSKKKIVTSKNKRDYQSPILMRAIKILSSARTIDQFQALKLLNGLIISQRMNGIPTGNHRPCKKINWISVLSE